jgi:hypothetical protein
MTKKVSDKYDPEYLPIQRVIEGNKLHLQTDPYVIDGEVYVKRIATVYINIIDIPNEVESLKEYSNILKKELKEHKKGLKHAKKSIRKRN